MTPRQKALVRELRKSEFDKCEGRLAGKNERCVLGVACDVFIADSGSDDIKLQNNTVFYWFGQESKHLPYVVKEYFGFRSVSGSFSEPIEYNRVEYVSLQHLNDESPVTLASAANFIRDNANTIFCTRKDKPLKSLSRHASRTKKKSS